MSASIVKLEDKLEQFYDKIKADDLTQRELMKYERKIRNIITQYVEEKIECNVKRRGLVFDDSRRIKLQKKRLTKCMLNAAIVYTRINKILVTNDRIDLFAFIWSAYFNRYVLPWRTEHGFDMIQTWNGSEMYTSTESTTSKSETEGFVRKSKTAVDYLSYACVKAIFNPQKMYLHAATENSVQTIAMLNSGEYVQNDCGTSSFVPPCHAYFSDEDKIITLEVVKSAARKASRENCTGVLRQMIADGHLFAQKYIDRMAYTDIYTKHYQKDVSRPSIDYRAITVDHKERTRSQTKRKLVKQRTAPSLRRDSFSLRQLMPEHQRRSSSDLLDAINEAKAHRENTQRSISLYSSADSTTLDNVHTDKDFDADAFADVLSTL